MKILIQVEKLATPDLLQLVNDLLPLPSPSLLAFPDFSALSVHHLESDLRLAKKYLLL